MNVRVWAVLAVCLLSGCIAPKRVFKAPDHARLVATEQELNSRVVRANRVAELTRLTLSDVKAATGRVRSAVSAAKPKLDELFRVSPLELHPMILDLQKDVLAAEKDNAHAGQKIIELEKSQEELRDELQKANAAKNGHSEAVTQYIAEADAVAQKATEERTARHTAEKALAWYRLRWWGSWVVLGAGVLVGVMLWIVKAGIALKP